MSHIRIHCNTLQHAATHYNTLQIPWSTLQQPATQPVAVTATHCTATHCTTLQHNAIHYDTLQHSQFRGSRISGHSNGLKRTIKYNTTHYITLHHTATHCNTLQHTATHCNTIKHTATHYVTLQHTATHCNTLQHTTTYCNTLQQPATQLVRGHKIFGYSMSHILCM